MCDVKKLKLHKKCSTPLEPSILFITKDGEQIGVCEKCWKRIADGDWEVGDAPKLTMEDILSDKSRYGENPVETEYKLRGKKLEEQKAEEDF